MPGNRHDVQGLYALLQTSFRGQLIGDNAYWPQERVDYALTRHGIYMTADTRKGFKYQHPPEFRSELIRLRHRIERYISLFDMQCNAGRTLNRSARHYTARRWTKALATNTAKAVNQLLEYPLSRYSHLHAVA
jgi:hypothetical protein